MDFNFPKINFGFRLATYLVLFLLIFHISRNFGFSALLSTGLGIFSVLFLSALSIGSRAARYKKYLMTFGIHAGKSDINEPYTAVMGAVPFEKEIASSSVYVNNQGVFIGRRSFYRFIQWPEVGFTKQSFCMGKPVLELYLGDSKKITVPWSSKANIYLKNR
jgi:hypothetical protein